MSYTLTFNEPVTGVAPADFQVITTGATSTTPAVAVSPTTGYNSTYTVTVNGISGQGTLKLKLANSFGISDQNGNTGSFQTQQTYPLGAQPYDVITADVNGDGKPDLIVTNNLVGKISVLLGNGDGTFQNAQTYNAGSASTGLTSVVAADFNGDGKLDLAFTSFQTGTVSVLLGNGDGTFQPQLTPMTVGSQTSGIAAADLNGDGKVDLIVANRGSNNLSVLLGNGNGTFTAGQTLSTGSGSDPDNLVIGDFNGDGKLDVADAEIGGSINRVSAFMGNGNGTFGGQQTSAAGSAPFGIAAGDFNGDGKLDLATAGGTTNVLLGNGNGTFQSSAALASGATPYSVAVGDLNGDGALDFIVPYTGGSVGAFFGNGNGTFQSETTIPSGTSPISATIADLNGDGRPDVVIANAGTDNLSVLLNSSFSFTGDTYIINPPAPDLQVTGLSTSPSVLQAGKPVTINWSDTNAGNLVATGAWSDHVNVTNTTTGQTLYDTSNSYTSNSIAANGSTGRSVQFTMPSGSAGAGNISVAVTVDSQSQITEYNSTNTGETNNTTTITPTSFSPRLVFIKSPPNTIAGTAFSNPISVAVEDNSGNVVTSDTSSITITLSANSNFSSGVGTLTAQAVNGIATFNNLTINQAGNYTLAATDGAYTSAISPSFVIGLALSMVGPTNVAAATLYSLALTEVDPGQNQINSILVNWGDGTTSTVAGTATSAGHTYLASGTHLISATYTSVLGISPATDTMTVNVSAAQLTPPTLASVTVGDGTGQSSIVKTYTLLFSQPVTLATGAIVFNQLQTDSSSNVVATTNQTAAVTITNPSGNGTTWVIAPVAGGAVADPYGAFADGIYQVVLTPALITNSSGIRITSNSVTVTEPSFSVLFGDYNSDGTVNLTDYRAFVSTYLLSSSDIGYNSAFDYNQDGTINLIDYRAFVRNYLLFNAVPPPPPVTPSITAALSDDTGVSNSDSITSDDTITGTVSNGGGDTFWAGFDSAANSAFTNISQYVSGSFTLTPAILNTVNGATLPDGTHILHLQLRDSTGATAAATNVGFTLLTTAPVVTSETPASGGTLGTSSANVSVTFSAPVFGLTSNSLGFISGFGTARVGQPVNTTGNTWVFPLTDYNYPTFYNPDMESPAVTTSGTSAPYGDYISGNAFVSNQYAYSGLQSVQLTGDNASISQNTPVTPGLSYTLSGYAMTPATDPLTGSETGSLSIVFLNSNGQLIDYTALQALNSSSPAGGPLAGSVGGGGWNYYTTSGIAPANAVSANVYFSAARNGSGAGGGSVYWDAVNFGETGVVLPSGLATGNVTVVLNGGNSLTDLAGNKLGSLVWSFTNTASVPVSFTDPNLAAAVRSELGIAPGAVVTTAQMAGLTTLSVPSESISSLQGLQYATNLTTLQLISGNPSTSHTLDLSPLSGLTNLTSLALQNVGLTNTTALTGFTGLTSLDLRYNAGLSVIAPLAALTNLKSLYLYGTSVKDLAGLNNAGGSFRGLAVKVDLSSQNTQSSTLVSTLSATSTTLSVASWNSYWPNSTFELQLDTESMLVTGGFGTTTLTVVRGAGGTIPALHTAGTVVSMPTTDEAFTSAGLAAALRHSVLADFQWVYNNVSFQTYQGMLKGPAATLQTRAGNDWDQAGLLIELLNDSGVKAQYAFGRITLSMGVGSTIANWLGVTDPTATLNLLTAAGLSPVVSGSNITFNHCWVTAWLPQSNGTYGWTAMDPSIKNSSYQTGITGLGTSVPFVSTNYLAAPQTLTSTGSNALPLQWYQSLVQTWLKTNAPTTSVADIGYQGAIIQQSFAALPVLAYTTTMTSTYESDPVTSGVNDATAALLTSGYMQRLNVSVVDLSDNALLLTTQATPLYLPQISLQALAISVSATGSATPGIQLTVGSQVINGTAAPAGIPSVQVNISTSIGTTSNTLNTQSYSLSGDQDYAAIGVDAQQWSPRAIANQIQFASISEQQKYDGAVATTNNEVEAVLQVMASQYLTSLDQQDTATGNLLHSIVLHPTAYTVLVSSDLSAANTSSELNLPFTTVPADAVIDSPGNAGEVAFSLANNATDATAVVQLDTLTLAREQDAVIQSYIASPAESGAVIFQEIAQAPTTGTKLYTFNAASWATATTSASSTPYIYTLTFAMYAPILTAITNELKTSGTTVDVWLTPISGDPANYYQPAQPGIPSGWGTFMFSWRENNPAYVNYHIFSSLFQSYSFVGGGAYAEKSPAVLPIAPGGNPDANQTYTAGDVNVANGNVSVDSADISLPGIGLPLSFTRHYDSQSVTNSLIYGSDNGMGLGWSFSYGDRLVTQSNGTVVATNGSVIWADSEGNQYTFNKSGSTFVTPAPLIGIFTANSEGFSFRDRTGLVRQFDSNGRLISITDHDGNFQTITYVSNIVGNSGFRQLLRVADGNDATRYLSFAYDPTSGDMSAVTDFTGRTWSFTYTLWIDPYQATHYLLTQVTDPAPFYGAPASVIPTTLYSYFTDAALGGLMQRVTNANGGTTTYSYYPDRRSFQIINPDGGVTTATYNLALESSTFTDADQNTNTYYFNSAGDVVDIVHPDQSSQSETWSNNLLQSDTDAFGQTETFAYDTYNNVTSTTDRLGNVATSTFVYFPAATSGPLAELISTTDADHHTTTYTYNAVGDALTITDPIGAITSMTYNSRGEVLTKTMPDGNVTGGNAAGYTSTFTYNSAGQPATVTTGLPSTVSYVYDAIGDLARYTDADGHTTTYSYDLLGRRVIVTDPLGNQTYAYYDRMGNVTLTIDPLGNQITSTYDAAQLLIRSTSSNGAYASLLYDAAGNLVDSTDGLGRATAYIYDALNRKVESVDPTGATSFTGYDGDSRIKFTVDPDGHTSTFGYDADSRRITTKDALGDVTTVTYDAVGNVINVTEPIATDKLTYGYDADNRQTLSVDGMGNASKTAYDADGNVTSVTDPRGNVTAYQYDVLNRRTLSIDALASNNQSATFYDAAGNITATTDFDGNRTSYTYDADNRQVSMTNALGYVFTKAYDKDSNVTLVTDANQHSTTYGYDSQNRRTSVTDALGETSLTAYDAAGEAIVMTDPLGRQERMGYDGDSRQTAITDPTGATSRVAYDPAGNITLATDALGHSTTITYDGDNRKLTVTDAAGDATTYGYDANGNKTKITDPMHNASTYAFDADNRETLVTDALGNKTTTTYDADSNVIKVTDPRGNSTTYGYDALNRRIIVTDALQNSTGYIYDPQGNLLFVIDPLQTQPVAYSYDALNRRITSTDAYGDTTSMSYDAVGNLTLTVDPNGNRTTTRYDADNRPIQVTDALGDQSETAYDPAGEATLTIDPLGRRTTVTYDNDSRPISVTDNLGDTTQTAYDAVGNVTLVTDPLGNATTTAYDAVNRKTLVTDPLGYKTVYTYNADSDLAALTDPDSNTTTYAYDADNRQASVTNTLGSAVLYAYDAAGNVTQQTDRDGRVTTFAYDADNRMITETWVGANYVITTGYDADSHVTLSSDPDATYTYTYDSDGRIRTQIMQATPTSSTTGLTYGYDADGNNTSVTDTITGFARGTTYYQYDALNREVFVSQSGSITAAKSVTFSYDADSELTSESRFATANASGTAVVSVYTYDGDGRLASLNDSYSGNSLASYFWVYDAAGRVIQQANTDGTSVLSYDADNEILSSQSTDPTLQPNQTYSYDSAGNRTSNASVTGPDNRLASDGTYTYQYDNEGNLILQTTIATGATTQYKWDYRDRLIEVINKTASGTVTLDAKYTYDAENHRIVKSVAINGGAATVTRFTYNGENVELEFNSAGAITDRYLQGPGVDNVLADEQGTGANGGTVVWTLGDNQGTIRDLVSTTGVSIDHISYDNYGNITAQTNPAAQDLYGYTGQQTDIETGLDYDRARYYSTRTGRFESEDPIGFAGNDENLYRYVGNSPLDGTDPSGNSWISSTLHNIVSGVVTATEDVVKQVTNAVVDVADAVVDAAKAVVNVAEAAFTIIETPIVAVTSGLEAVFNGGNPITAAEHSLENSGKEVLTDLGNAASNVEAAAKDVYAAVPAVVEVVTAISTDGISLLTQIGTSALVQGIGAKNEQLLHGVFEVGEDLLSEDWFKAAKDFGSAAINQVDPKLKGIVQFGFGLLGDGAKELENYLSQATSSSEDDGDDDDNDDTPDNGADEPTGRSATTAPTSGDDGNATSQTGVSDAEAQNSYVNAMLSGMQQANGTSSGGVQVASNDSNFWPDPSSQQSTYAGDAIHFPSFDYQGQSVADTAEAFVEDHPATVYGTGQYQLECNTFVGKILQDSGYTYGWFGNPDPSLFPNTLHLPVDPHFDQVDVPLPGDIVLLESVDGSSGHMGVFTGDYDTEGNPMASQMGKHGPKTIAMSPENFPGHYDPEYFRPNGLFIGPTN